MAYTDINDVLPYLRGGQPGQPTPPGSAGMGWLQYLSSMFGPQAMQQAAMQAQPSIADAVAGTLGANQATGAPMQLPGNAPAAPAGTRMPPVAAMDALVSQPPGYLSSTDATGGVPAAQAGSFPNQLGINMPWPGPGGGSIQPGGPPYVGSGAMAFPRNPGPSVGNAGGTPIDPNAPAPDVQSVNARTPAVNPRATGGQSMQGVTANNDRFIPIQYQTGGGGQGGRNAPIYTAANFGGPQTAAMLAPQGYMRQPVPGPMARGGGVRPGQFPYGRSTTPGGPFMPFDITGYPVAGVNATGPLDPLQKTPAQLAKAVQQPNWPQTIGASSTIPAPPDNASLRAKAKARGYPYNLTS